jgi:hypothetical protein
MPFVSTMTVTASVRQAPSRCIGHRPRASPPPGVFPDFTANPAYTLDLRVLARTLH